MSERTLNLEFHEYVIEKLRRFEGLLWEAGCTCVDDGEAMWCGLHGDPRDGRARHAWEAIKAARDQRITEVLADSSSASLSSDRRGVNESERRSE